MFVWLCAVGFGYDELKKDRRIERGIVVRREIVGRTLRKEWEELVEEKMSTDIPTRVCG